MTPEQLEAIPGIGPKTVEKITIAVNNYFSSLESGEVGEAAEAPVDLPADALEGQAEATEADVAVASDDSVAVAETPLPEEAAELPADDVPPDADLAVAADDEASC